MDAQIILGTLDSLHFLSGSGLPTDAGGIGRRIGRSASEVAQALLHLERRGLVDASRARLTLQGLAAAVALAAQRERAQPERTQPERTQPERAQPERSAQPARSVVRAAA